MITFWESLSQKGSAAPIQQAPKAWLDKAWTCFVQGGLEMFEGVLQPAWFSDKGQSFTGM